MWRSDEGEVESRYRQSTRNHLTDEPVSGGRTWNNATEKLGAFGTPDLHIGLIGLKDIPTITVIRSPGRFGNESFRAGNCAPLSARTGEKSAVCGLSVRVKGFVAQVRE
ncbi:MAG: hypothetical protein KIT57_07800 [Blastocatellales bacterium]|nr:hypothetical protein [Blastocatellales bacterium]